MTDRLVIFDLDGVLVDSERIALRCLAEKLAEIGYAAAAASNLDRFVGGSAAQMVRVIEGEMGRPVPAGFLEALRRHTLNAFECELQAMPGAEALLRRLAAPRCVASSSQIERIRRSLEIAGLFDLIAPNLFSVTMVRNGKPAPDLYLFAAERMGAERTACIVVEDSVVGVRGGKAAGMAVIGFVGGSHVEASQHALRLAEAGADCIVGSMAELEGRLAAVVG